MLTLGSTIFAVAAEFTTTVPLCHSWRQSAVRLHGSLPTGLLSPRDIRANCMPQPQLPQILCTGTVGKYGDVDINLCLRYVCSGARHSGT